MPTFEILCTTMNQSDFSKIMEMNIHSNIVYANQAATTRYDELDFETGRTAKMITTTTRGVGKNRNLALIYATADICLLADDDMVYVDNVEKIIVEEFARLNKADAIIFNVISDNKERNQVINTKSRKMSMISRNPYGAFRVAFRLNKIRHYNIWFSTMFGGGTPYPSGEDSLFIRDMRKCGMNLYISDKIIGRVKQDSSTWYKGMNESFFRGKGAFLQASRKGLFKYMYLFYFAFRTYKMSSISFLNSVKLMLLGMKDFMNT